MLEVILELVHSVLSIGSSGWGFLVYEDVQSAAVPVGRNISNSAQETQLCTGLMHELFDDFGNSTMKL